MGKKVVVLGAGYAGILVAKKLEKKLKGDKSVEITIIDKNPFFTMLSELHEVAANRVDESHIRVDLKKVFAGRNVNVVLDEILDADLEGQKLTGKTGKSYPYDFLVMASGCKSTYWGVKGAEEHTFPLWSYEETIRLRDHIGNMFREAARETDPKRRKALLTFYVIGAGFTGIEMIAELAEYTPIACEKYLVDPSEVTLINADVMSELLPHFPKKASDRVHRRMTKLGIDLKLSTNITEVRADGIDYVENGKAKTDSTYTVIWNAGIEGSDIALKTEEGLGHVEGSRGRIQTDEFLRSINHPNVYVGGDNTFFIPEGHDGSVPQMVEHCEHGAPVIAANIVDQIKGKEPTHVYKPEFHGSMVSVGGRYASAHVGLPGKFFVLPSFFAMLSKHFVAILFYLSVAGYNKIFAHIRTEFFTIRDCRSITGGHLSNRSATFMLFPLRIWLGIFFIYQGYVRFALDWGSQPLLYNALRSAANEFRPVFMIPYTTIPASIRLGDWFYFSTTMSPGGYSIFWLQTTPVGWFIENFVIATDGQQIFWQVSIMLFCFLMGLAFLGGLLTPIVSIATVIFAVGLMLTTGITIYAMYLFFAPLAFLFSGGGRVLSLDYYFMPWLHKKWKNIPFVKKWYLYN
ncbi:MAG: NAD(P)/FAD-dependent oxidoreductase [Turicibacter sp.]|nr:NAD(P)/FAD-dependent oxidoreductase [Turicibacter sp.]